MSEFVESFYDQMEIVHQWAHDKGFWEDGVENRNDSEMLMLAVTELAEAVEALRHGDPPDDKIPDFSGAEAEIADCVIRLMDQCAARGWRLPEAIEAKHRYNMTRPRKHGKKF